MISIWSPSKYVWEERKVTNELKFDLNYLKKKILACWSLLNINDDQK